MLRVTGAHQVVKGSCGVFCHPFRGQASSWYRAVCAQPRGFHDRTEVLTFRAVLIEAVPKRKSIALNPPTWCSTMSLETKYRFLLLYASQKGQAKAIAEEISEKANEKGFFADLYCLSQLEKFNLEKECAPVVIITSTTGSGELPDTAKMFFKEVCGIAAPHHYAHIKYALLALGDSNYSEFANGGKIIDKQFQRLGADHFYATGYADDSVGLEIVVDPWIDNLWDALAKVCPKQDNIHEDGESISDINDNSRICKLDVESPDASEGIKLRLGADSNTTLESLEQNTSLTRSQEDCPLPAWVQSEKPLSESTLAIPALPIEYLNVVFQKLAKQDPSQECSSLAPDFTVFQNTSMTYEPGDAFSIVCPNSGNEVEYLIERLGLGDKRDHVVDLHIQPNTKKKGAHLPGYIPKGSTLQFILTWCLEIRAVPKKACLRALVEYTSESSEKRRLQELSSKQGAADYNRYIRDFNICLLDILRSLPSCNPPFTLLVEHLPKLQARSYSAASSSKWYPGKLHFVFNIVEFPSTTVQPIARRGVCTGWLAQQVTTVLQSYDSKVTVGNCLSNGCAPAQISIFRRQNAFFHLPTDTTVPLIMVGPGTGVAPFIGFLQHRQKQREENPECTFGETWLFYGCRHCDRDYLFRNELRHFQSNGTLTQLKVCFSRETTDGKPKYVHHLLQLMAHDVIKMLLSENGYLYVCGDGKNMAKDVNSTLTEIISEKLGLNTLEAMKIIANLREEKRYLQDVWS
ncbi:methionine synthase reductase isoform X2 [Narcine bancroftii]|uniref:methionine synthase reductase isoform X2 n=1 Tax=Narcine bancroftii TaxID=1343680 RepID=UPI0038313980